MQNIIGTIVSIASLAGLITAVVIQLRRDRSRRRLWIELKRRSAEKT